MYHAQNIICDILLKIDGQPARIDADTDRNISVRTFGKSVGMVRLDEPTDAKQYVGEREVESYECLVPDP